ncbi:nucleotidyltransferase [Longispora fulva]|uniref:Putative nucleotidyltransferase n=1 Tax=Longispora fulva TaxID=619741 RepID=A0A8J7KNJ9_9ACTN|nr:nucleotidyltransferase domain-containing protein [Longispora fulva]MBG6135327.1 putative nucleotidyltransferase [Longispora fulva]GIG56435.1 nucleotidyltransferase [Longispora fulva]
MNLVAEHTLLSVVAGSRAFGLATATSDHDRRGVYAAPAPLFWRFDKPPTHLEGPEEERFSWEVERFCGLALTANPNILEVLHSPLVEVITPLGEELLGLRDAFLSRKVHQTYLGYVRAQLNRAENAIARDGTPTWKHVMHLLRLLDAGTGLLATGALTIDVGAERERLLAVRRGEVPWDEVRAWHDAAVVRFEKALPGSPLPAEPDKGRVEDWLVSVRRRSL